ncbi:MAG: hypothetical protein Q9217_004978 [Psora testacea]
MEIISGLLTKNRPAECNGWIHAQGQNGPYTVDHSAADSGKKPINIPLDPFDYPIAVDKTLRFFDFEINPGFSYLELGFLIIDVMNAMVELSERLRPSPLDPVPGGIFECRSIRGHSIFRMEQATGSVFNFATLWQLPSALATYQLEWGQENRIATAKLKIFREQVTIAVGRLSRMADA